MMKRNVSILHLINGNWWATEREKKTYRTDYVHAYIRNSEPILMMDQNVNEDAFCVCIYDFSKWIDNHCVCVCVDILYMSERRPQQTRPQLRLITKISRGGGGGAPKNRKKSFIKTKLCFCWATTTGRIALNWISSCDGQPIMQTWFDLLARIHAKNLKLTSTHQLLIYFRATDWSICHFVPSHKVTRYTASTTTMSLKMLRTNWLTDCLRERFKKKWFFNGFVAVFGEHQIHFRKIIQMQTF